MNTDILKNMVSVVGVEGGEEVDTEVGHYYGRESEDEKDTKEKGLPVHLEIFVERNGIEQECNKRPCLFRIPCPVTPPRDIRPHRSGDNTHSKKKYARCKQ